MTTRTIEQLQQDVAAAREQRDAFRNLWRLSNAEAKRLKASLAAVRSALGDASRAAALTSADDLARGIAIGRVRAFQEALAMLLVCGITGDEVPRGIAADKGQP